MRQIFVLLIGLLSLNTHSGVIYGETGRFCPGQTVTVHTAGAYIERVLVSAEGIRRDGFIKVYADGNMIFNIGVPGYDPDYSFRVRRTVQELTFKFEQTCSRILDLKVFTKPEHAHHFRRYQSITMDSLTWGDEVLEMHHEFGYFEHPQDMRVFLRTLKKLGLAHSVQARVRDVRSLEATLYALKLAKLVRDNKRLLERYLLFKQYEWFLLDLLTMKEDILEAYDVRARRLDAEILEIASLLDQ
jgi:hypothetical protein